jgi:hypothetical protein
MRPFQIPALALAMAAGVAAAAADVAYLRNGESLDIAGFRLEGGLVYLEMRGGGEVALPSSEVREIRRMREPSPPLAAGTPTPPPDGIPAPPPGESAPVGARPDGEEAVLAGAESLDDPLPAGAEFDQDALRRLAGRVARRHGLSEALVQAVVQVESRYDAFAVSPRGAMGLMQLMPKTARRFQVDDVFDPVANLDGGVRYLKELLELYRGEIQLALAAYNAGEMAVERYGGVPPFRETMQYVDRVLIAARIPLPR